MLSMGLEGLEKHVREAISCKQNSSTWFPFSEYLEEEEHNAQLYLDVRCSVVIKTHRGAWLVSAVDKRSPQSHLCDPGFDSRTRGFM